MIPNFVKQLSNVITQKHLQKTIFWENKLYQFQRSFKTQYSLSSILQFAEVPIMQLLAESCNLWCYILCKFLIMLQNRRKRQHVEEITIPAFSGRNELRKDGVGKDLPCSPSLTEPSQILQMVKRLKSEDVSTMAIHPSNLQCSET
jgi:hypothetical protein